MTTFLNAQLRVTLERERLQQEEGSSFRDLFASPSHEGLGVEVERVTDLSRPSESLIHGTVMSTCQEVEIKRSERRIDDAPRWQGVLRPAQPDGFLTWKSWPLRK